MSKKITLVMKIIYIFLWINPITLMFMLNFVAMGLNFHFLEIDACIDRGSSWNNQLTYCNDCMNFNLRIYVFEILFFSLILSGFFMLIFSITKKEGKERCNI